MVTPYTSPDPYLQTQAAFVSFLTDAFAGNVPGAVVPVAPVRVAGDPQVCTAK
jgi:hypothetical protein